MKRIIVGADHAGYALKAHLAAWLTERGWSVEDMGTDSGASVDYPDFAHRVASAVEQRSREESAGEPDAPLGLLVCGTGVGMSMTANKHPQVRAVACSEPYSARMAREHNDANVLCVGARVVGTGLAEAILEAFLGASFEGGRHARRVAKVEAEGR